MSCRRLLRVSHQLLPTARQVCVSTAVRYDNDENDELPRIQELISSYQRMEALVYVSTARSYDRDEIQDAAVVQDGSVSSLVTVSLGSYDKCCHNFLGSIWYWPVVHLVFPTAT